ncbi:ABC transporter substrate-binding protein [Paraburkholderia fungorum]|jgi:peptide/nickel transport system substrate-binding protein|uniref:ABC transporter substrate-binding protein n=1 Tax=Paraburkholderia fungorum TaxID=134537 RepID=A0AAP5QHI5_9BURK|nr:ABC transporter substrate-binding protein [Paraburkholderia fungorum]MDT8843588.1 ABC transporter substrate-binding protein [Paraburkholderia fungorum]
MSQTYDVKPASASPRADSRQLARLLAVAAAFGLSALAMPALAQNNTSVLVVAGPRTPESLDQEYPPTEASHEARRNVFERLLTYEMKSGENGVTVEDFGKLKGALAESWETSPDKTSITFHLRSGVKSYAGNTLTADDVMWTFQRGWNLKATFRWYMTQVLKISDFDAAFKKIDDHTVKVTLPGPSPLIERIWVNNDLGIIDSVEIKKHITSDDQWGSRWLAGHSASFAPYQVTKYSPGQEVVYESNKNYYRGAPKLTRIVFREMPTSANRLAALQAGAVDVAEWLAPREQATLEKMPGVKVWKVYGNYIQRVEMNNSVAPFDNEKVRQALNYAVPREQILKSVFYGTARPTKSPVSEIYPAYTDQYFHYTEDLDRARALLKEAGFEKGFKTQLGYPTGDQTEEELAIILKTAFSKIGVDVELQKLPASTLVERYSKGTMPMYFFRDMAIVPDAAYVTNLWLNSASLINYSHYKNAEVDKLINDSLSMTDEAKRKVSMERVQQLVMGEAPWVFLINPGYQLATRANIKGYSWNTTNGNTWYDFSKN